MEYLSLTDNLNTTIYIVPRTNNSDTKTVQFVTIIRYDDKTTLAY